MKGVESREGDVPVLFGWYETPRVCECGFETYSRALYWECRLQHEAENEQKAAIGPTSEGEE